MTESSTHRQRYLFALVDGGGTVPPELGTARRLVDRGHDVVVLAEDSMASDVAASGAAFRPWAQAPNRPSRRPEDDPLPRLGVQQPAAAVRATPRRAVRRTGTRLCRGRHGGDRRAPARPRRVLDVRDRRDGRGRGGRAAVRRRLPEHLPAARAGHAPVRPRAPAGEAPARPGPRPRDHAPDDARGTRGCRASTRCVRRSASSRSVVLRPGPPGPPPPRAHQCRLRLPRRATAARALRRRRARRPGVGRGRVDAAGRAPSHRARGALDDVPGPDGLPATDHRRPRHAAGHRHRHHRSGARPGVARRAAQRDRHRCGAALADPAARRRRGHPRRSRHGRAGPRRGRADGRPPPRPGSSGQRGPPHGPRRRAGAPAQRVTRDDRRRHPPGARRRHVPAGRPSVSASRSAATPPAARSSPSSRTSRPLRTPRRTRRPWSRRSPPCAPAPTARPSRGWCAR